MADNLWTMADSVASSLDLADIEVSDLRNSAPFLMALPEVDSSNGAHHKYVAEDGAATVGYRAENTGRDMSKSSDRLVDLTLSILDWSFAADKAVADGFIQGAEWFLSREAQRHLRQAMFVAESQFLNGQAEGDATGHPGFADALNALANAMVIGAGGTTGELTSVYLVRAGLNDCVGVYWPDGMQLGETVVTQWIDGTGKTFPAYYTPAQTLITVQLGSVNSIARIANIDEAGNGLDDALIASALNLFPANRQPTHIVMNTRSRGQLQASRTATNPTGQPAPMPESVLGMDVVTVDSLGIAETQVT